ncbi:hypothetical protein [Ancylomarina longa]|uniref:Uncharacterized protein n=1 Tax=Ancylomarina longa TaxID=2487017 RepID=A0A434AYN5_9BACT|nr:hypothetical protein [Ancylomarina longa]RUT79604.1 hypothetical protein DLK05_02625 [Ancylomarina longa]
MKTRNLIIAIASIALFACNNEGNEKINDLDGTYIGTLTSVDLGQTKSFNTTSDAVAEITSMGDQIEVHCYGGDLDTTYMLNYYQNKDSVMVCITGTDFENMYGHMLGGNHMSGGMMSDKNNNETEWMHHLNDEHQAGDEHFGGFNMSQHTFDYTFHFTDGNSNTQMKFSGVRNN